MKPEDKKGALDTQMVKLRKNLNVLRETEHNRWSVAQVLAGYDVYPMNLLELGESQKDEDARLHGCIIPNDNLEVLGQKIRNDKESYIRYDTKMCAMCLYGLREREIKIWKCKASEGKRNGNPWFYPKTSSKYVEFADIINKMAD